MAQAIVVRYSGPTNSRGSRYVANAWAGRVSRSCDNAVSAEENAALAARKLAEKYEWTGLFIMGGMPDGQARVYVWASDVRPDGGEALAVFGIEGRDWFFVPMQARG